MVEERHDSCCAACTAEDDVNVASSGQMSADMAGEDEDERCRRRLCYSTRSPASWRTSTGATVDDDDETWI